MFGTIFAALFFVHAATDHFVQTDHQAQHKGLRGLRAPYGRWNCVKHVFTYVMGHVLVVPLVMSVDGITYDYRMTILFICLNGVTHYVIDRRWTLETFARAIGKGSWIDNDPEAMYKMDQAAHITLLGVTALLITAAAI